MQYDIYCMHYYSMCIITISTLIGHRNRKRERHGDQESEYEEKAEVGPKWAPENCTTR
jgi:hypothetical protein